MKLVYFVLPAFSLVFGALANATPAFSYYDCKDSLGNYAHFTQKSRLAYMERSGYVLHNRNCPRIPRESHLRRMDLQAHYRFRLDGLRTQQRRNPPMLSRPLQFLRRATIRKI